MSNVRMLCWSGFEFLLNLFKGKDRGGTQFTPTTLVEKIPEEESPVPEADPEEPLFTPETRWRYNLNALQEILHEDIPAENPYASGPVFHPARIVSPELPSLDPRQVRERIHSMKHIPVLKSVSQSFQLASRNQNANLSELGTLVRRDPGLHAKILRMVNSSFFRFEKEITDIEHAIILLGLDRIRFMAQTLEAVQDLNKISTGFDLRHLWSHSFACGLLSEYLAQALQLPDLVHAYSAGLLHDIGKIILSSLYPEHYRSILRESHSIDFNLNEREKDIFGCDHEDAGGIFAEAQSLPSVITAAISQHSKAPASLQGELDTACILFISNNLAKRHHLGFSGNSFLASDEDLIDRLQQLSSSPLANLNSSSDTIRFLENLRENVVLTLPRIHREVEELLRITFGRSAPIEKLSRSA